MNTARLKKHVFLLLCILCVLYFTACESERTMNSNKSEIAIPKANAYIGELSYTDEKLNEILISPVGTSYVIGGEKYRLYSDELEYVPSTTASTWIFDLSRFCVVGNTPKGELLFAIEGDASWEILLLHTPEGGLSCFVQENSTLLRIETYALENFWVQLDGSEPSDMDICRKLFAYHTEKEYDTWGYILDGSPQTHTITLTNKEFPAILYYLCYEEHLDSDEICVKNVANDITVVVSK